MTWQELQIEINAQYWRGQLMREAERDSLGKLARLANLTGHAVRAALGREPVGTRLEFAG
jgi:hypothetical protein